MTDDATTTKHAEKLLEDLGYTPPEWHREKARNALIAYAAEVAPKPSRFDHLEPVPLILHCPACGVRHIDRGAFATKPHHTHACQGCGHVWRPSTVDTFGVAFLPGFHDADTAELVTRTEPDFVKAFAVRGDELPRATVPRPPPIGIAGIRKMDKRKADMVFVREDARALLIGAWPQRVKLDDTGRLGEITLSVDRLEGDPQAANVVEVVLDRIPDVTLTADLIDPEGWEALSDWATAWLEREIERAPDTPDVMDVIGNVTTELEGMAKRIAFAADGVSQIIDILNKKGLA